MAILSHTQPVKSSLREQNIRNSLESFRQRVRHFYPNAVFETEFVLGTTIPEFIKYIESLMKPGMSWENKKELWSIRSIKQAPHFKMDTAEGFYNYFNYSNMKPEWKKVKGFKADPNLELPVDRYADQMESS